MSLSKSYFAVLATAVAAALAMTAGCSVAPKDEAGVGGSTLTASLSGADPAVEAEFAKGEFKLFCACCAQELGKAKYVDKKLDFKLNEGATIQAGALCHVNMEMDAASRPQGKLTFFQGEGIFYPTNKPPVVNSGGQNVLSLEIFKSYSVTSGDTLPPPTERTPIKILAALYTAGQTEAAPLAGRLYVDSCTKNKDLKLDAAARVISGKTYVEVQYDAVPKGAIGDTCKLRFLADGSRKAYRSMNPVVLAEQVGTEKDPTFLAEVIEGKVDVNVTVAGSCRKFDASRACAFVFPEECALPLGEVAGAYDEGKWLRCVSLAAGSTLKSLLREGATIQQEADRAKASRPLQTLQQIEANMGETKVTKERAELLKKRIELAKSIVAKGEGGFGIDDHGVSYGVDLMVKVMDAVRAKLEAAPQ